MAKDKYQIARSADMPRGKRFLLYHEALMEWRDFLSNLRRYREKGITLLEINKLWAKMKKSEKNIPQMEGDVAIVKQVMAQYKDKF